jgi:DNA-binding transcriptional regulator of glucitol operon
MKNNQVVVVLVGLMFMMALGTAWIWMRYTSAARELQDLTFKIQLVNNTQGFMQQLLTQAVEYSKTHPDINPLLHPFTNNPAAVSSTPGKPVAK